MCLDKGAGSRGHFSGSKNSVQLPAPRPMSCSVQFQECTWNTSVHVTNVIFTAGREVNSSDSKSAISVVMAKALFQVFQHKLSVLPCLVRIKSSCCNSFLDFWIPVCSLGFGRRPGASWVAQEVSAAPRLGLCPAVLGQN